MVMVPKGRCRKIDWIVNIDAEGKISRSLDSAD